MSHTINFKKTKETLEKLLAQAKDSVQVLEALQKEGMARAKEFMNSEKASQMANDKLVSTLKKLGLATRTEVRDLEKKVEELASELRGQISKVQRTKSQKSKDTEANA